MKTHIMTCLKTNVKYTAYLLGFVFVFGVSAGMLQAQENSQMINDKQISNRVSKELMYNSTTPSYLIDVETHEGIVTLSGSVNNLLASERAVTIARMIKGVRGVVNQITIDAPQRTDEQLERDVKDALLYDPATESYEIDVAVLDGTVNLDGEVDSWQEKELAGYVVKGVTGVKALVNNIDVDFAVTRTDEEIKAGVERALSSDVRVDDGLIEVNVDDSKVTLSGTVGSANEKFQAEANAWVAGVTAVDIKDLAVKSWARDEALRKDKYTAKSDEEIEDAIKDAFVYDPRVFSFKPEVEVDNGVVILNGTVDNLKAKHAAEEDARNVVGVFSVQNYIKVRPPLIPDDPKLAKSVSNALLRNPYVDKYEIDVSADNGIISLKGAVDSQFEKEQAEDIVARTKGVLAVENRLKVDSDYDSYFHGYYGWNPYTVPYAFDFARNETSDWELQQEIEQQLWWSPYVNEDEVLVQVANGKATLNGTVDTQREKLYAEINALQAGASSVENNLDVSYMPEE